MCRTNVFQPDSGNCGAKNKATCANGSRENIGNFLEMVNAEFALFLRTPQVQATLGTHGHEGCNRFPANHGASIVLEQ